MLRVSDPRRVVLAIAMTAVVSLAGCGDEGGLVTGGEGDPTVVDIEVAARDGIRVGDVVEVPEDHELVTPTGAEVTAFDEVGDGRYQALEAGTFDVVTYEEVPCGGPVDAFPAYTLTVEGSTETGAAEAPSGFHAATVNAPACG